MKKIMAVFIVLSMLSPLHTIFGAPSLYDGFQEPAMEYGPRTWWHWINETVSKDGITKDLEAMKDMGYKGAHMVNLPQGGNHAPGQDVFGTPIWYEKVEHAAKECERLGLELSFGSCVGWVAGGPWVPAELSMQDIVWRHKYVKGPIKGSIQLPQPNKNRDYYRDIAVLAYPSLPGEAQALATLTSKVTCAELPGTDWTAAIDGDAESFVELPSWKPGETSRSVIFEFKQPVTVRSLSLQLHEDSENRVFKLFWSDDGTQWTPLTTTHRWMKHFDPRREEFIDGFADRSTRFVKLEMLAPSPKVGMKLYEVNFLSARVNQLHTKAGRQRTQPPISNPSSLVVPADQLVQLEQILDLTRSLKPDETLECTLPAGDWTILRFGHTSNGNEIHPASSHTSGLETDKFSVEALEHHFKHGVVDPVLERMGDLAGTTVTEVNIDSWEANCQTWTKKFPEEFEARRGYDLRKWLVALSGQEVRTTPRKQPSPHTSMAKKSCPAKPSRPLRTTMDSHNTPTS